MAVKIIHNQSGYTMFELLISLAIIVIISSIVVIQIQVRDVDKVRITTEELASNLRQVRNLATSRIADASSEFPIGGYGINFNNDEDSPDRYSYLIFGDVDGNGGYTSGVDSIIDQINYRDQDKLMIVPSHAIDSSSFTIIFKNEHQIISNISPDPMSLVYSLDVRYLGTPQKAIVQIYDKNLDGYTWGSINVSYESN